MVTGGDKLQPVIPNVRADSKEQICCSSSSFWSSVTYRLLLPSNRQTQTSNITTGSNQTCQTDFSADLYGLGVRLGYYLNWASGWTANNFVPDEIAGAQDSNSIFLLGVLASLLRGTTTGRLTRLDGLVLLELAAGTVWSVLSL